MLIRSQDKHILINMNNVSSLEERQTAGTL